MDALERTLALLLTQLVTPDALNTFLREPRHTAILVGALLAFAGALLGTFLLLRGASLVTDAVSHSILLGIVVVFLLRVNVLGLPPDLSSPWLLIGAAAAGVATVLLTELIARSGLVRQDAALGLVFTLMFALAILLIGRYASNTHLDVDAVTVGEIGLAWANTRAHCLDGCESVTITPDHPQARTARQCTNCAERGLSPRHPDAVFAEVCANCGTYSPAEAFRAGLLSAPPTLVFWPRALTVMGALALLVGVFVLLLGKELALVTFDSGLAHALGFRPGALNIALMTLVSLVAVGAFDAVGAILVIAFFILPPATAYLLTRRLGVMLLLGPLLGIVGVVLGYDLARGVFLGLPLDALAARANSAFGWALPTVWRASISASMVLMLFVFFLLAWVFSPQDGLLAALVRRALARQRFHDQVVLGHIAHHAGTPAATDELAVATLHTHFRWAPRKARRVLARLRALGHVAVEEGCVALTPSGAARLAVFQQEVLGQRPLPSTLAPTPDAP